MLRLPSLERFIVLLVLVGIGFLSTPVQAQVAPARLQAALLMKMLAFDTNLGGDPFTIHVVDAPEVAAELRGLIGTRAGKATLSDVTTGASPVASAKVIYVGSSAASTIAFTQEHKILSVTGNLGFVSEGVTLGIVMEGNKPKILLNVTSSEKEGIDWNPAVLKVAVTIR